MMNTWLIQHWHAFLFALKRFISAPLASLLSIVVIGIAFSLPVGVYTLLMNMQAYSGEITEAPQLSLFFKLNPSESEVEEIRQRLESHSLVTSLQFVSKELALQQLAQSDGLADVVGNLGHNPLPDAFVVTAHHVAAEELDQLRAAMLQWPAVDHVQFDAAWAMRLDALLKLGRLGVILLATLLSLALVVVMFNTIRMQILTKRDEIEVSKLIGATDSFIRRPFLYFGAIQGLAGGITAWLIIALGIHVINNELVVLSELYAVDFHLKHLATKDFISLLLFSAWLGWLGARLSVASYLWQIEPK
jgi:cell division transport system permease protein